VTSYSSDLSCLAQFDIPKIKDDCVNYLSINIQRAKDVIKQHAYLKFVTANKGEDFLTFLPIDQQPVTTVTVLPG